MVTTDPDRYLHQANLPPQPLVHLGLLLLRPDIAERWPDPAHGRWPEYFAHTRYAGACDLWEELERRACDEAMAWLRANDELAEALQEACGAPLHRAEDWETAEGMGSAVVDDAGLAVDALGRWAEREGVGLADGMSQGGGRNE